MNKGRGSSSTRRRCALIATTALLVTGALSGASEAKLKTLKSKVTVSSLVVAKQGTALTLDVVLSSRRKECEKYKKVLVTLSVANTQGQSTQLFFDELPTRFHVDLVTPADAKTYTFQLFKYETSFRDKRTNRIRGIKCLAPPPITAAIP